MIPLAVAGAGTTVILVLVLVFLIRAWWAMPIPVLGMDNAPDQPIAFSHTVHVEGAGIQCEFCHRNVAKGDAATVPAVQQCLFCHKTIKPKTVDENPELAKLLAYAGVQVEGELLPPISPGPIDWNRVHRLPDHVQFAHEPHIRYFTQQQGMAVGQVCSVCHGDVAAMAKVEQVRTLKMGDCVDCHSKTDAPTDCTTCHY